MMNTYKIWATIEEITTYDDGEEDYEQHDANPALIGEYETMDEAQAAMNRLDPERL